MSWLFVNKCCLRVLSNCSSITLLMFERSLIKVTNGCLKLLLIESENDIPWIQPPESAGVSTQNPLIVMGIEVLFFSPRGIQYERVSIYQMEACSDTNRTCTCSILPDTACWQCTSCSILHVSKRGVLTAWIARQRDGLDASGAQNQSLWQSGLAGIAVWTLPSHLRAWHMHHVPFLRHALAFPCHMQCFLYRSLLHILFSLALICISLCHGSPICQVGVKEVSSMHLFIKVYCGITLRVLYRAIPWKYF